MCCNRCLVLSLKAPTRPPLYIRAELWLVVSPTRHVPDNRPRGSRDKQGMGEEVRAKAAAMARSSVAASPGAAVELGQASACSFVSQRRGLAAWHVPLPAASPTPLPAQQAGTSRAAAFTGKIPTAPPASQGWQGGGKSRSCFHGPNSPTVLAAAPSPTSQQLSGLAAMGDPVKDAATPLSYCCLCGGCRVSSLKDSAQLMKTTHSTSGQPEVCGVEGDM